MSSISAEIAQKTAEYERRKKIPVKAVYPVATTGARTRDGGILKAGSFKFVIDDLPAGRVGDQVTYADGSTATITSGAGFCFIDRDKPVAIVGSHLSNGDVIVGSPNETLTINEPEGEPPIRGLLDPTYVPPSNTTK